MLSEKPQAAIEHLATLSPEAQEALAAQIESWLANARWGALLATSGSHAFLDQLIDEAKNGPPLPANGNTPILRCRAHVINYQGEIAQHSGVAKR